MVFFTQSFRRKINVVLLRQALAGYVTFANSYCGDRGRANDRATRCMSALRVPTPGEEQDQVDGRPTLRRNASE